jgi:hypothetical protein
MILSRSVLLGMRNTADKIEQKIILCSITLFRKFALYELKWKNIVESDRPQMTKWRMRMACWVSKATTTHSKYVIRIAFHYNSYCTTRLNVTLYVYCLAFLFRSHRNKISCVTYDKVGRDSSVGIATGYGLDGPGIESRWGEIFRNRPDRAWGPPSLLYNGDRVSVPGVKRPGCGVDHPPHLAPRFKKE